MGKTQNKQDDVLKPNYINNHIMCKQQEAEMVKMDKKAIPSIAAYTKLTLNTKTQRR